MVKTPLLLIKQPDCSWLCPQEISKDFQSHSIQIPCFLVKSPNRIPVNTIVVGGFNPSEQYESQLG